VVSLTSTKTATAAGQAVRAEIGSDRLSFGDLE